VLYLSFCVTIATLPRPLTARITASAPQIPRGFKTLAFGWFSVAYVPVLLEAPKAKLRRECGL